MNRYKYDSIFWLITAWALSIHSALSAYQGYSLLAFFNFLSSGFCFFMARKCSRIADKEYSPLLKELIDQREDDMHMLRFYRKRIDALQEWQSKMRDPERTIVCDILANGCTLEPAGDRYNMSPASTQWQPIDTAPGTGGEA